MPERPSSTFSFNAASQIADQPTSKGPLYNRGRRGKVYVVPGNHDIDFNQRAI